jgi:hypothetical protein
LYVDNSGDITHVNHSFLIVKLCNLC